MLSIETDLSKDILVGIIGNMYSELTKLSEETGYIEGQNLGSISLLFKKANFLIVIEKVLSIGYKIETEKTTFTYNEINKKYPSIQFYITLKQIDSYNKDFSISTKTYVIVYEKIGKKSSSGRELYR
jgi:hypothetical protein